MPLSALHEPFEEWIMNSLLHGSAHCSLIRTCPITLHMGKRRHRGNSVYSAVM